MLAGGIVMIAMIVRDRNSPELILDWKLLLVAPGSVLVGLLFLYSGLKPFRFRIDEHGLTLRLPDESALARSVGWGSVEAIMLEPRPDGPPRLVLVPAAGVDLGVPAEYRNAIDGRASIILLSTSDVRETPDRIDAALRRYAGDRYPLAG
jgi:hypothetical protein